MYCASIIKWRPIDKYRQIPVTLITILILLIASASGEINQFPFRNPALSWKERTDDLVRRLTVDEVIDQMSHGGISEAGKIAPAISRLGIKPYQWDTECLHGHMNIQNATVFPQSIGLAATFSQEVIYSVAEAISSEVRANFNNFSAHGEYGQMHGMSCFSPMPNILRHPTWGRNQETYGEDPYLAGQVSSAYVKGMHGSHPRYARVTTVCKAFDAYTGPENNRMSFSANITNQDLRMTFLPQFEECAKAGAYGFMCSYNGVNGVPTCMNEHLLTDVLRNEWGFSGYVVSDMNADRNIVDDFKLIPDYVTAAVRVVKAGQNLELSGGGIKQPTILSNLRTAVEKQLISRELLYERVWPLFYTRMRLGEFDPAEMNPYSSYKPDSFVQSQRHRAVATEAAAKSFVLLKNDGLLPLKSAHDGAVVVGPFSESSAELNGDYSPYFSHIYSTSPADGIRSAVGAPVTTVTGCESVFCRRYNSSAVIRAVSRASLVFLCLGTGSLETEGRDRPDMNLVHNQAVMITDVLKTVEPSTRVVLLLFSAGPVSLPEGVWSRLSAALQLHFPGQAAGDAIYQVLSGKVNPAGRLPYTWYSSVDQVPDIRNYSMSGRTYRYMTQTPVFPFGYGLSYSNFRYSNLTLDPQRLDAGQRLNVFVNVTNLGPVDGDEVTQMYVSWPAAAAPLQPPRRQLVYFNRLSISNRKYSVVHAVISQQQLRLWSKNNTWAVVPGEYTLYVGGQQPDQNQAVPSNVLMSVFYIT